MTTPTTRDFTFKWASTETDRGTASTTINYTSTTSIPIWRYNNLQKIVVKTGSIKNPIGVIDTTTLNFILFDKTRDSNPALTDNNPFNLHDELLKFEKVLYTKIPLYGQPYNHMYYVNMEAAINNYKTSFYRMGMDRTFNVTYTYNYFEYVTPKSIGLPLQFLFNDYILTASDVTTYKTMGYTVNELIEAGLKYNQLIDCGYDIINDLFPVLFEPSGIAVQCIEAINNLKNNITQLTAENSVLTDDVTRLTAENSGLNNECAKLNDNNGKLTDENNSIKNINTILNRTNKIAINTNDLLQTTNNTLHSTNTALKVTNDLLQTTNNTLHSTNTALRTLQTRVPLNDSIPDDRDYYINQEN